jgi:osmotically-inducible protein OsmY
MQSERTDEELQGDVRDELLGEPGLDVADIGVTVERGVVILDGHVPNAAQRRLAEEIVARVPGVRAVVDDLEVRSLGTHVHDEVHLARAVLDALDWNVGVPDDRVKVVVHDGRVRLEGIVDRPEEKDAAEAAVCDVLGRGSVENAIVVRPRVTPGRTEDGVKDEPRREDDLDTLRIDPRPGGGESPDNDGRRPRPGATRLSRRPLVAT